MAPVAIPQIGKYVAPVASIPFKKCEGAFTLLEGHHSQYTASALRVPMPYHLLS